MIVAVLDSNVLLSGIAGLHVRRSTTGAILRAWSDGAFSMAVSEHILDETRRGLGKPYFRQRVSPGAADLAVRAIRSMAIFVEPAAGIKLSPDDADNLVIATAISSNSGYLVTGDAELLGLEVPGICAMNPAQFLKELGERARRRV